jgi:pilus assembly protein CpaF
VTDQALVRQIRKQVADQLSVHRTADEQAGRPPMDHADQRQHVRALISQALARHNRERLDVGEPVLDQRTEETLAEAIHAELFGLGRLQPYLDDPHIENINVNGCDQVFLKYADGTKVHGEPVADSDDDLVELIRSIGSRQGLAERRFDTAQPQLDLRLPDGSGGTVTFG